MIRSAGVLEELPDLVDGCAAQHDLEHDSGEANEQRRDHDHEVLEQHAELQQDDAEGGKRVKSRERRSEEGAGAPTDREQPEHHVAQPMIEQ